MIESIEVIEEVPYASRDISNVDIDDSMPISVEVVAHKAYLIEEHSNAHLNFQIFRLNENRINRNIVIYENRESSHRENAQILINRIKCILYTMVSIPITILLVGYVSTLWNHR